MKKSFQPVLIELDKSSSNTDKCTILSQRIPIKMYIPIIASEVCLSYFLVFLFNASCGFCNIL